MNIPISTYIGVALQAVFGLGLPAALYLFLRKKYNCKAKPFWIGCGVMLIFALELEQAAHSVILATPFGQRLAANPIYLAVYGGFMAALFEEGGRFIAFRYILKDDDPHSALMYGAGHGGFEAFAVMFLAALSNFACIAAVRAGETDTMLYASVNALISTPFYMYPMALLERCAALCAQIGLSVTMYFGVKKKRGWIALAALMHFALDAISVSLQTVLPVWVLELLICGMAAVIALTARKIWRKSA